MENVVQIDGLNVFLLTKKLAEQHIDELLSLFRQIPQVEYTKEEVLAESKGERIMYGKWEHSLVIIKDDKVIGIATGYERKSEENEQYPSSTLYFNELAISPDMQKRGLGRKLVESFLQYNRNKGFLYLDGPFNFSVQTNAAEWNNHVQNLYKSLGFITRATKNYDNRTDVIMGLNYKEV